MIPKKADSGEIQNMLFILGLVLFFSLVAFVHTWRHISFANLVYEITELKKEKKEIYKEVESLRLRVANYSTPERIEKLYRDKLGYFPVTAGDRIVSLKLPEIHLGYRARKTRSSKSDSTKKESYLQDRGNSVSKEPEGETFGSNGAGDGKTRESSVGVSGDGEP